MDALIITKDISRATVLCLSDLLEPVADGITGDFMEMPSTSGEKILQAMHDMKQDLKLTLEIERAAIQKTFEEDVVDLAGIKEQITDRVMAEVVDLLPTPGKPPLDPHQLSFAERRQMFSSRVAATVEPEEQHCNSNIGNEFIWNSNATEFSPIFVDFIAAGPGHCKGDDASLQVGADYRDSAADSVFELVYSEQSRLKRYCFKCTEYFERLEPKCRQGTTLERLEPKWRLEPKCLDSAVDGVFLNLQALKVFCFPRPHSDLHEVMYSNQDKMKRHRFMKHEQVLSDNAAVVYSDEECARIPF